MFAFLQFSTPLIPHVIPKIPTNDVVTSQLLLKYCRGNFSWTTELFIPVFLKYFLNDFLCFFIEPHSDFGSYVSLVMRPYSEGKHCCRLLAFCQDFLSCLLLLFSLFFLNLASKWFLQIFLSLIRNYFFVLFFFSLTMYYPFMFILSHLVLFLNFVQSLILLFSNLLRALHSVIITSHSALLPSCSLHYGSLLLSMWYNL